MTHPTTQRKLRRYSLIGLCLVGILMLLPMILQPQITVAQLATSSPLPTLTYTPSPYTPSITPTPSNTPTTIPTLAALLNNRQVIKVDNAQRLQQFRIWQAHVAQVKGMVFIPQTNHLVSVGNESGAVHPFPIRVWDILDDTISPIGNFFEKGSVYGSYGDKLSLSPDGKRIIALVGNIEVWDAQTGFHVARVKQVGELNVNLDANNTWLVVGADRGIISMWNIPPGAPDPTVVPLPSDFVYDSQATLWNSFRIDETVSQIAYEVYSNQILVLTLTGRLLIYRPLELTYSQMFVPQAPVTLSDDPADLVLRGGHQMVLDSQRQELTYTDTNRDIVVYDVVHYKVLARYPLGHPTTCLRYSPDKRLLLVTDAHADTALQLIDTTTWKMVAQIPTGQNVLACGFSSDGKWIATGGSDGQIALWGVPK